MRQAVIYINVPKELKNNYHNVFREQNTACLETAIYNDLLVQKTFFDFNGKIYNQRRPNLEWLINYLDTKKDKPYVIIVKTLDAITPIKSELEKFLKLIRRRIRKVSVLEVDEENTELLKELGLLYSQFDLNDAIEIL